ncbi:MAG: CinA family protein, partial [Chloroflexota bacterium]
RCAIRLSRVQQHMRGQSQRRHRRRLPKRFLGKPPPGGGTPEKPVGLTYIGLAMPGDRTEVRRYQWKGDRLAVKKQSANAALQWLIEAIQAASR